MHDGAGRRIGAPGGRREEREAWFKPERHTVYASPTPDSVLPSDHPVNRQVLSTKVCIKDDQVSFDSPMRQLCDSPVFRSFLCEMLVA